MLHLLYIVAFTVLAFLAIANLIRNLMTLGLESQRSHSGQGRSYHSPQASGRSSRYRSIPHPELLDEDGNLVNEPFLVMRSMTVEDARERLDAIYRSSPGGEAHDEAQG